MLKKSLALLQFSLFLSVSYAVPQSVQFLLSFAVIASVFPGRASATSTNTLTMLQGNSSYSLLPFGSVLESQGNQYIVGTNYIGTNAQKFRSAIFIRFNNESQSLSQMQTFGDLTTFQSQFILNDSLYGYGGTKYNSQLKPYISKNDKNLTHLNSWIIQGATSTALSIKDSPTQNHICFCTVGQVFEIDLDAESVISAYSIKSAGNAITSATMIRLQDGDYLFSGKVQSKGWVAKLKYQNSSWSELWSRNLVASSSIIVLDAFEDNDRLYLTGTVGTDAYIAAINASSGENLWTPRSIGGSGTDGLRGIQKKSDGSNGLMAYGYTSTGMTGSNSGYWVLSFDANGNIEKNMNFNGTGSSISSYVLPHSSGAITMFGYSTVYGGALGKPLFVTTDNNGDIDKTILRPYGFSYNDMSSQMTLDATSITNSATSVSFTPISGASLVRLNVSISDPGIQTILDVTATHYPTSQPSSQPTGQPANVPSGQPTGQPTGQPSDLPSAQPTGRPSDSSSGQPTSRPSDSPSAQPTGQPSDAPSGQPTGQPSDSPSAQPTGQPSDSPSAQPTGQPSDSPSAQPTGQPSDSPSAQPTGRPSDSPSAQPTGQPSDSPSAQPTGQPSDSPSAQPTGQPSDSPSAQPTGQPSDSPSVQPTGRPSDLPSAQPADQPTGQPANAPSAQPTGQPSDAPSAQPTGRPSDLPSAQPSDQPTGQPSDSPSGQPTGQPSDSPSVQPTGRPSDLPSAQPTGQPANAPSVQPSSQPTSRPSDSPSGQPTSRPTGQPSGSPSGQPTGQPANAPSGQPTSQPANRPSSQPAGQPTHAPSAQPTGRPSRLPSGLPSNLPSSRPTGQPSSPSGQPTRRPTVQPGGSPSGQPTGSPTARPSGSPSNHPTQRPTNQPSDSTGTRNYKLSVGTIAVAIAGSILSALVGVYLFIRYRSRTWLKEKLQFLNQQKLINPRNNHRVATTDGICRIAPAPTDGVVLKAESDEENQLNIQESLHSSDYVVSSMSDSVVSSMSDYVVSSMSDSVVSSVSDCVVSSMGDENSVVDYFFSFMSDIDSVDLEIEMKSLSSSCDDDKIDPREKLSLSKIQATGFFQQKIDKKEPVPFGDDGVYGTPCSLRFEVM